MSSKRMGLGRNLSALLGEASQSPVLNNATIGSITLPITSLQPGQYQPRGIMSEAPLGELAESIRNQGVLQPLLVREIRPNHYEIIAGERRWRASQLAGLTEVPVLIKQVDNETAIAMALVENLQREDLNAMDQARAMHRLIDEFQLTHQQIATLLSKSRTAVSNHLRLLNLTDIVKHYLECGDLDMGHARALLTLSPADQAKAADIVIAKKLSVRETEQLVSKMQSNAIETLKTSVVIDPIVLGQVASLAKYLNTKVQIKTKKSGKQALIIDCPSEASIQSILASLMDMACETD
jgi:ParB family chromosome partitioning protein